MLLPSYPPWQRFAEFIAPEADRFTVLKKAIIETRIKCKTVTISGNRHFFIAPPPEQTPGRRTILVAHYDRAPGSPGANDNSAAVFMLIETATRLLEDKVKNWIIIFTDKEELEGGEGFEDQGAYTLGIKLKDSGLDKSRIFSFDACGTGDTLIISTTAEYLLKNDGSIGSGKILASVKELKENAMQTARNLKMTKLVHPAPTPFSDDAGFLRAGIAAQTITALPSNEYTQLVSALQMDPEFTKVLVNQQLRNIRNSRIIPETWRCLNGPKDTLLRLTPQHFHTIMCFAEGLCRGKGLRD
jgi:hypothetical protein